MLPLFYNDFKEFKKTGRKVATPEDLRNGESALLPERQYAEYTKTISLIKSLYKQDCLMLGHPYAPGGIEKENMLLCNQKEAYFKRFVFDAAYGCFELDDSKKIPSYINTIYGGGSILCCLISIAKFYGKEDNHIDLGNYMIDNKYRTPKNGVRWTAMDKIPEIRYGISSNVACSLYDIIKHVVDNKEPALALVPGSWICGDSAITTNVGIILYQFTKTGSVLFASSVHDHLLEMSIEELFRHIKMAWLFHDPNKNKKDSPI